MLGSMPRILVTGATGFVGGAAARRFVTDGDEVVAYVRDADSEAARALADLGATVRKGSIGDPNAIADAAEGCDTVVHCAAVADLDAAPRALRWVNVAGTENVVNAAKHAGCRCLVHLSCADVTLSDEDHVNWSESQELIALPLGEHARSKRLGEEIALAATTPELRVIALRPTRIWGPGDFSQLPRLCVEARAGGIRLVGSGANLTAITYIDNLVDAIRAAIAAESISGRAYYVADNELVSFREVVEALCRALSLPPPKRGLGVMLARAMATARREGPSPVEVVKRGRSITFDISGIQNDLGFEPRVGLAEGMEALSAWAETVGGAEGIAARARPPADAASVDAQVAAAGGD